MLKHILNQLSLRPYKNVPNCPSCESARTGYYFLARSDDYNDWVIKSGLKNGEILEPIPELYKQNCFCKECGHNWFDDIKTEWVSPSRIDDEKDRRETKRILKEIFDYQKENGKPKRKWFSIY